MPPWKSYYYSQGSKIWLSKGIDREGVYLRIIGNSDIHARLRMTPEFAIMFKSNVSKNEINEIFNKEKLIIKETP